MNTRRTLTSLSALVLLTALSSAQGSVRFRGQVEDVSGTQNQFFVDCTNVALTSAAVNLNLFVGQETEIEGLWNGSATDPSVQVTAVTAVTEDFSLGGGGKIGDKLTFDAVGAPGTAATFYFSLDSAFFPLPAAGAVLIDPATAGVAGGGTIPAGGRLEIEVPIPANSALAGLVVHGQALLISGSSARMTTTDCLELRN